MISNHPVSLQLTTLLSSDMSMEVFNSIPGQGVIYSVIVRDPLLNTSASYVPVHTYACSFTSTLDSCQTLGELLRGSDTECVALTLLSSCTKQNMKQFLNLWYDCKLHRTRLFSVFLILKLNNRMHKKNLKSLFLKKTDLKTWQIRQNKLNDNIFIILSINRKATKKAGWVKVGWRQCGLQMKYWTSYSLRNSRKIIAEARNVWPSAALLWTQFMIYINLFFIFLTSGKISTKIFFTVAGLAGLFVCFFGHRFFKCGE